MNLDLGLFQSVFNGIVSVALIGVGLTAAGIYFGWLISLLRPEEKG